jgi:hypothetical protein
MLWDYDVYAKNNNRGRASVFDARSLRRQMLLEICGAAYQRNELLKAIQNM